ncbi:MAG TPA: winged helix-turn-helix domain-containing protein [Terriglobia bacterium]|jgi:TolB-like protein/DNA-binding winged helix-turn-helix (wHTH) protein/Tfp pilus assembly protein PilF|nr:winged helix-turn-helix domain-containing protein [Terriglobia bacterium]
MGTSKTPQEILQLGPFQLLVGNKVLLRDDQQVPLAPRAVEVLAVLAARANEIVSKDDLMRAVWPDTFVEEVNLAVHISALRKLLAAAGGAIQIETIAKRGYRLLGDVRAVQPRTPEKVVAVPIEAPSEPAAAPPVEPPPAPVAWEPDQAGPAFSLARPLRPRTLAAIALAIVLLVLAGVWLDRWAGSRASVDAGGARIQSLAVLPLENLSGDPGQDYFAAGITDDLTTELAHIHGLRVVSRTSASQFQSARRSLPEIARALSVDGVIEGSVVRAGNRVRITTQLIEAASDRHLWAGTYEDSVDEVIALQDRVARDVARQVRAAVKPEDALLPATLQGRPAGVDRQAYDDYLQGLYAWNRRDQRTFSRAIEYFSRAAAEDPHFAAAFASLADAYVLYALNGGATAKYAPLARRAALEALAQDANSAEAHAALGATSAALEWDWDTAGREFQRAIELDPNYATGHEWYADFYLVPELQLDAASKEMETALTLDPLSPIMLVDDGWVRYLRGEYPQARQQFERALAMDPDFIPANFRMEGWCVVQGRDAEFAQYAVKNAHLVQGDEVLAQAIEQGFARDGIRGVARAELERYQRDEPDPVGLPPADYYVLLGKADRACSALANAVPARDNSLLYMNVDPRYARVRKLACYDKIAREIGLPQLPSAASDASDSAPSSSGTRPQAPN